jgi:hypothetical protein
LTRSIDGGYCGYSVLAADRADGPAILGLAPGSN